MRAMSARTLPNNERTTHMPKRIKDILTSIYEWANRRTGGSLGIFVLALQRFNELRGPEAAASISFFAIFSLFPLLLFLVSALGYVLVNVEVQQEVLELVQEWLPISRQFISDNLVEILERRGAGGLAGLAGLAWAGSGVFLTLSRNINRAWPGAALRNALQGRLAALAMVGILTVLAALAVAATATTNLLRLGAIFFPNGMTINEVLAWRWASIGLAWLLSFAVFLSLYRWIPKTRVRWREAVWGALLATIAWRIATGIFTWFLSSGMAQYDLVYGSLGTMVAFITWVYMSATITLFGAHLSAAIATTNQQRNTRLRSEEGSPE